MTQCEVDTTVFGSADPFATNAIGYEALDSYRPENSDNLEAWKAAINQLLDWRKDTSQLMDEEMSPPTPDIIDRACELAAKLRDKGQPGPLRVVPDGEGGIVFERRSGSLFQTISVEADGRAESISFENSRLTERRVISPAMPIFNTFCLSSREEAVEVSSCGTYGDIERSALLSEDVCSGRCRVTTMR